MPAAANLSGRMFLRNLQAVPPAYVPCDVPPPPWDNEVTYPTLLGRPAGAVGSQRDSLGVGVPTNELWFGATPFATNTDGSLVLIGATYGSAGGNPTSSGRAYMHTSPTAQGVTKTLTEVAIIDTPTPVASGYFGGRCAMAPEDLTIAIAGQEENGPGGTPVRTGAVHIFTDDGSNTWPLQQTIYSNAPATDMFFGASMDFTSDGNTLFVGSSGGYKSATTNGIVEVFTRSGNVWTYQTTYLPDNITVATGLNWGADVSVNYDGTRAVFGTTGDLVPGLVEQVQVFEGASPTTLTHARTILSPDNPAGNSFGYHNKLSKDGLTLVIGTPDLSFGSARLYDPTDGTLLDTLAGSSVDNQYFGWNVAISDSGQVVSVVSPYAEPDIYYNYGRAYVYIRTGNTWNQERECYPYDWYDVNDDFGYVGYEGFTMTLCGNTVIANSNWPVFGNDTWSL